MARYGFYEIRSARNAEAEQDDAGGELHRRSYACGERADLSLFAWFNGDDELQQFQLLFREHFVSWSRRRGLAVGVTSRHDLDAFGADDSRVQGVRSMHGTDSGQSEAILTAARDLLSRADLPPEVDQPLRTALG